MDTRMTLRAETRRIAQGPHGLIILKTVLARAARGWWAHRLVVATPTKGLLRCYTHRRYSTSTREIAEALRSLQPLTTGPDTYANVADHVMGVCIRLVKSNPKRGAFRHDKDALASKLLEWLLAAERARQYEGPEGSGS